MIDVVEEPLALSAVENLTPLCCYFYQDLRPNAVHRTLRPGFYPRMAPFYQITFLCSKVSVIDLALSIFSACDLDQ